MIASKLLMAAFLVGAAATSIQGSASRRTSLDGSLPLQTISFDESQSVGTVGTGCTWLGGTNRTRRVSMADDRAAVKLAGRVSPLAKANGEGMVAKEALCFRSRSRRPFSSKRIL